VLPRPASHCSPRSPRPGRPVRSRSRRSASGGRRSRLDLADRGVGRGLVQAETMALSRILARLDAAIELAGPAVDRLCVLARTWQNSASSTGVKVRPQIPGFSPGGLGPHLTSSGSRPGSPPVSRLPSGVLPLRPPSSGFPSSGVLRFRPFGRRCPVPFPVGFPPVSFPFSNLHASTPEGRSRRHWSRAARTKVTSTGAIPGSDGAGPPATQMLSRSGSRRRTAAGRRASAPSPALSACR